jgi:hypothetical protein
VRLHKSTDYGVYETTNGGARWDVLGFNLPSVNVMDSAPAQLRSTLGTWPLGSVSFGVSSLHYCAPLSFRSCVFFSPSATVTLIALATT